MNRTYSYFYAQWKRIFRLLPMQLLINLIVCVSVGALALFLIRDGLLAPCRQRYKIGVVGSMSDSYLGFGIQTLQTIDDARQMVELVPMSETEARTAFQRGELYAFVKIPDGLVESIESGANDRPVTYVASEGQKGIGSIVMTEIVDVVSDLVTCSQSGIYGMQKILTDHGETDGLWEATVELNYRYFDVVLSRKKLYDMELLGAADGLSTEAYYFCSILILFLLISGVHNSLLFSRRDDGIPQFLAAKGIGAASQTAAEYLAYTGLMLICILEIFFVLAAVLRAGLFRITEWGGMPLEALSAFFWKMIPVVLLIAAMQFLLYELVSDVVSSMILQFLCCIGMGYLSGFFYPVTFFPEVLKTAGRLLPTGAAFGYLNVSLTGEDPWAALAGVSGYLLGFLALSVLVRRHKIQRGQGS